MKLIQALLTNPAVRSLFAAVAILQLAVQAHAADAPRYAVLSLVGDHLMLAQRLPATDAQAERSVIDFIDLDTKLYDETVLVAINTILQRVDPANKAILLDARDPALYTAQARLLDEGSSGNAVLRKMLAGTKATHLILVTRLRAEARLGTMEGHLGSGPLEGLGFYFDRSKPLMDSSRGEAAPGFLAPFAYFQISIYDIARHQVLRQEQVMGSRTISAARSVIGDPWEVLSPGEKAVILQDIITKEIAREFPKMVRSIF